MASYACPLLWGKLDLDATSVFFLGRRQEGEHIPLGGMRLSRRWLAAVLPLCAAFLSPAPRAIPLLSAADGSSALVCLARKKVKSSAAAPGAGLRPCRDVIERIPFLLVLLVVRRNALQERRRPVEPTSHKDAPPLGFLCE